MPKDNRLNLHNISTIDELLFAARKGFDINERNSFEETPLLCAVRNERSFEVIEKFIELGADVDAGDCWGITPLYSAITKRGEDLELIKLLLENGAEIKGGKPVNDRALEKIIMQNRPCAKLLIKYKFLKNYRFVKYPMLEDANGNRNYYLIFKDVVNMNIKPACYDAYAKFLDECAADVLRMQGVQLSTGHSFIEFVSNTLPFQNLEDMVVNKLTHEIFSELSSYPYFVYRSMIISRIGREYLISCIEEQLIEMNKDLNGDMKKACLNSDLMYIIAKYLSDEDLLNFSTAHLEFLPHI